MRKLLLTFTILFCLVAISQAQAPSFFNYQGVARNAVGNALVNKTIKLRLTIREGSALGIVLYSETRVLTTNAFGLFNVQVGGAGATNTIGSMAGIAWNVGSKYMQVEIDPENGSNLKDIGTTQLTSVPYALYANQSSDVVLPFVKSQNEESPLFKVTNTGNNANSLSYEGVTNSTANNAAAIRGIITSVSPGVFSAAVVGQNNGTAANGIGVYGNQNGSGWGVYGTTPAGVGVYGNSNSGTGVYGQSVTGVSVMGFQPNTGTNNAGLFQNTSTTNTAATLKVQTNGIGEGANINQTGLGKATVVAINNAASANNVMEVSTNGLGKVASFQNTGGGNTNNVLEALTNGTGRAAYLQNTNAANGSNILEITSNGTGRAAAIQNTNAANAANVLDVSTNGLGRAGLFQNTNAANTAPNVSSVSNGAGDGVQSLMSGTGKAGLFNINNAANANFAIDAGSNGTNNVINSINTGLGRAGFFQVNNPASTADALSAVTNGTGPSWAIRGTSSGTNGAGLFIQSNATNTSNNLQSNQAGLGRAAFFNATNAANTANALEVNQSGIGRVGQFNATNAANTANALESNTAGTGFAASFTSTNAAPKALRTQGAVQLTGIGEANNKILSTDNNGNATWQTAAAVGIVTGTGTLNYLSKWTPGTTNVGTSQVFDDGDKLSIGTSVDAFYQMNVAKTFKVSASALDTAVAIFENTNGSVKSDGIVIKLGRTHPRWNGSAYANVPNPMTGQLNTQMNQIRDWIYGNDTFSWDDLINLMPAQAVVGTVCNLTNYITSNINNALSLPYQIGPYSTPAIHIWDRTTIFGGITMPPGIPDIPSIAIPALDIPSVQVIPRITAMPAIPQIPCGSLQTLSFPTFVFTDVTNTLSKENEYISFVDKSNRKLGAIRAQSIQNFSTDYFDGQKMLDIAGELIGIDLVDDFVSIVAGVSQMAVDYNNIGVEYSSGNGDYAEWLERENPKEDISYGDIVGVKGGKITKDLRGAEQIMAVSKNPIVLGNTPDKAKVNNGNNIAFMGQIPVKVIGAVTSGDYIVARNDVPGYGIAIHPKDMKVEDFKLVVGRSWDSNEKAGPKMVNTVVGVHNHDFLNIIGNLQQKADKTEERLKAIEAALNINNTEAAKEQPKKAFKK